MKTRKQYDQELHRLKQSLYHMGQKVSEALKGAITALQNQDEELAERIVAGDHLINQMEEDIEEAIVRIITREQPVASDLRQLIAALKITTSVERIGDFAVDIAKTAKRVKQTDLIDSISSFPLMIDTVHKMIQAGLEAYVDNDAELAHEMAKMDDHVDKMYSQIVQSLMQRMIENPDELEHVLQLAYVARYFERMADHCTNIGEAVLYIVKGKRLDLNQ
ncbi:phosphate uptake regulator, PhoU [Caldalkalibacillus thermarum TA2.A1]|uniref:Phosphate-specific transport system accessory protein PhoU n=2 Tax=Caldalkalibacillus TaxID=379065 RepID=F5L7P4_CALTT|nr:MULTISPECIES: phosphate signaling complex protein PhoU [Caldalkalibacillus]EGL82620.1 phosphate uptake regulator, PhoU [Caldalkalibacillus thermarum TA2.A1]MDQ0340390.1 phosphate transport system protein [Caldalkalibacillus uzonensis]QZT33329.1 phosphate signaling complex protein PhoU [Caldalkalibacillus thermarum TA2.A1]